MMPGLRERVANFLSPRTEAPQVIPNQEIAYSESLFNTGSHALKYDPDSLRSRRGGDIYNRMMLDEQVKAVVRFRRDAITGRDFFFQFAKDVDLPDEEKERRIALFNTIVDEMRGSFVDALNAIMAGVWQGYSITEKVFGVIEYEGKPYIGLHAIKKKPYSTFRFNVDEFGNVRRLEQDMDGSVRNVPMDKVIHYVQNPEMDEHYGGSELREAYRSWFSKDVAIKFWNIYLERSAGGVWIARAKEGHSIIRGSGEYTNILNVLGSLSASSSVLLPASIDLEHIAPTSNSQYKEAIEFHDLSIAKALLVPNLLGISHTGQTGAFSQSQTQFKAFMLVLNADTTRLEAVTNEQLFRQLGAINFADGIYPRFTFKPLSIDQILEMLKLWNELVGKDTVEPSDTDEAHIRNLLEMPDKGEPLPRRPSAFPSSGSQPGQPNEPPPTDADDPDQLEAARDRVAWKASFTRAIKRVRFTVIDRKSQDDGDGGVDKLDAAIERIVAEVMEYVAQNALGTPQGDARLIGKVSFAAGQKGRVKTAIFGTLQKGWNLGEKHAQDEIQGARRDGQFKLDMKRLQDNAADYLAGRAFTISGNLTADVEAIIQNTLANGVKYSWTQAQVKDAIYKTLVRKGLMKSLSASTAMDLTEAELLEALEGAGLTPARLDTIVRTNYFDALNEARYNMFTDPDLGDFVEAMEYSAILDSRTTPICSHLDGRIFAKDSPNWEKYRPPNHYNCRSVLIAVTAIDTWKPSRNPTLDPQDGFR